MHVFVSVCLWIGRLQTVYLRPGELVEVRSDVEADPVDGSRQTDAAKEQDDQHEVGVGG